MTCVSLNWSKTAIAIIILISIYLVFIVFSDIEKIISAIRTINKWYLFSSIVLWVAVGFVTSVRWHFFLGIFTQKIPFIRSILYYLAGYVFVFSPGGAGEIVRSPFIKKDYGIPISQTAPIVLVERFYDLLGITILISIGLIFSSLAKSVVILPASLALVLFLIMINKNFCMKILRISSKIKFVNKMIPSGEESYDVIFRLIKTKFFLLGTFTSVTNSVLTVIAVYLLIVGMGENITFSNLTVIYQASNFIAAASLMPGGIGVFEGGLIGLLTLYKIKYEIALSVAILVRLLNTGLFSAIGLVCLKVVSKNRSSNI